MDILLLGIVYCLADWLVNGVVLENFICFYLSAECIEAIRKHHARCAQAQMLLLRNGSALCVAQIRYSRLSIIPSALISIPSRILL